MCVWRGGCVLLAVGFAGRRQQLYVHVRVSMLSFTPFCLCVMAVADYTSPVLWSTWSSGRSHCGFGRNRERVCVRVCVCVCVCVCLHGWMGVPGTDYNANRWLWYEQLRAPPWMYLGLVKGWPCFMIAILCALFVRSRAALQLLRIFLQPLFLLCSCFAILSVCLCACVSFSYCSGGGVEKNLRLEKIFAGGWGPGPCPRKKKLSQYFHSIWNFFCKV